MRAKLLPLSPCIHNSSGLPLPSFHAYQHKTNRRGAVKSSQQFLYVLYTPCSTTSYTPPSQVGRPWCESTDPPRMGGMRVNLIRTTRNAVTPLAHERIRQCRSLPVIPGKERHAATRPIRSPTMLPPYLRERCRRYSNQRWCSVSPAHYWYHPMTTQGRYWPYRHRYHRRERTVHRPHRHIHSRSTRCC